MLKEPEKDNREFHKFMEELSTRQQKRDYANLVEKAAEEERKRGLRT